MKSIHRALKLHAHKHTGKVLAHKHTSYRVLFLLLLAPIAMMTLVDRLQVAASEYSITAKVPAPMPSEAPIITTPDDGVVTQVSQIEITGTCPVITPAVIIAVYDNGVFAGSDTCASDGMFSVAVSLAFGTHKFVAMVVTITDDVGQSSQPINVTRPLPVEASQSNPQASESPLDFTIVGESNIVPFVHIMQEDTFVIVGPAGRATWRGSITSGTPPYNVEIDWGDSTKDTYRVADNEIQEFAHDYDTIGTYKIIVTAVDAKGSTTTIRTTATTRVIQSGVGVLDGSSGQVSPIVAFLDRYIWHIYIFTISSVVFLWYIEHGRHIVHGARLQKRR